MVRPRQGRGDLVNLRVRRLHLRLLTVSRFAARERTTTLNLNHETRYFPRFAVHLASNRSLWAVPVIESPSAVPEYSIVNEPFGVSRVTVKVILFPVTEPATGASPRCPFSVPFSVLPSC